MRNRIMLVLERSRMILANMALENKSQFGQGFGRWLIHHEPLRADAANLLPLIDEIFSEIFIGQTLQDELKELTKPNRELDCELHEFITGQIDMQTNETACPRYLEREHGRILLDLGSERLRYTVPCYTANLDEIVGILPRGFLLLAIMDGRPRDRRDPAIKQWTVKLVFENEEVAEGDHDDSAALAACLALVKWKQEVQDDAA